MIRGGMNYIAAVVEKALSREMRSITPTRIPALFAAVKMLQFFVRRNVRVEKLEDYEVLRE